MNVSSFVYASERVAIRGWVDQRSRATVDQEGARRHPGGIGFREPEDGLADSLLIYLDEDGIRRLAKVTATMVEDLDAYRDSISELRAEDQPRTSPVSTIAVALGVLLLFVGLVLVGNALLDGSLL